MFTFLLRMTYEQMKNTLGTYKFTEDFERCFSFVYHNSFILNFAYSLTFTLSHSHFKNYCTKKFLSYMPIDKLYQCKHARWPLVP